MGETICVVGLGYVGLPLAVEFSKNGFNVIGFDIDKKKIEKIKNNEDPSGEIEPEILKNFKIDLTMDEKEIKKADFVIVAVPTPLTKDKGPDMGFVKNASKTIGKNLKKEAIVVYESTVYPGATEEEFIPIIEKISGMKCGKDFKVGYSPERINPGDKVHTIDKIVKIVSGVDEDSLKQISALYKRIIKVGVYEAPNIKTAEAAKVIENTQRDLNIALVNELSLIFERMGLDTMDVINAAGTKWNFHKYYPGLVGGHCISVDPHYLLYKSKKLGYNPKVILAGRDINDYMPIHVAKMAIDNLSKVGKDIKECKVLIMGLAFKENVKDIRNSKVKDVMGELKRKGVEVVAYDPLTDKDDLTKFGVENISLDDMDNIDCIILTVAHDKFREISLADLKRKMNPKPILIDVKSFFDKKEIKQLGFIYKTL